MAKIWSMLSYFHICNWILEFRFNDIPCNLEAVIKAIEAFMSSSRSEFSKLKKLGSLQSSLWAACDLIEPEMLWARSKNAKRRLEAIVEAMDENIENKWFFLLENYYNSLGIKGFSHNCTNSLRTTVTYAKPCMCRNKNLHLLIYFSYLLLCNKFQWNHHLLLCSHHLEIGPHWTRTFLQKFEYFAKKAQN